MGVVLLVSGPAFLGYLCDLLENHVWSMRQWWASGFRTGPAQVSRFILVLT